MTEPAHDPYAGHRAHVELAITHLRLDDGTAERLRTHHEAAMRLDPETGCACYADGSADPAAWLRGVEARDPSRLGRQPRPASASDGKASADLSAATLSNLFIAARGGDAAALAELGARMRGVSAPTRQEPADAPNLTRDMLRAKAGDKGALKQFSEYMKR